MESSNDTLLFGNYLELTITYHNIEAEIEPVLIDGFTIISNPAFSNQYKNINGVVTTSNSYSVHFEPNEEGVFLIPPIEVEVDDRIIVSNGITIIVLPNPEGIITTPKEKDHSFFFDFSQPQQPPILAPPSKPDPLKKKRKKI